MRLLPLVLTLVFAISSPLGAWFDAGHKMVASIAFRRLTPAQQAKVVDILRQHPRFKPDFLEKIPAGVSDADRNEWFFQQAAIWPDLARNFPEEDLKEFHRGTWHYISIPSYLFEEDERALAGRFEVNVSLDPPAGTVETMNAIQTIRLARRMLVDDKVAPRDKGILLAWLFHLVGDIHQPLHSTAMFSQKLFPDGDRGGNLVKTVQRNNLHSLWDGFPGGYVDLGEARQSALKLLADADLTRLGEKSAAALDEKDWLAESRRLAIDAVYTPDVLAHLRNLNVEPGTELPPISLDEAYLQSGGRICEKRVVEAGYRLGEVLKQIAR